MATEFTRGKKMITAIESLRNKLKSTKGAQERALINALIKKETAKLKAFTGVISKK